MNRVVAMLAALLVLVVACGIALPKDQKNSAGRVDLGLFAKHQKWGFNNGAEFPGARGSFKLGTDGGKAVGILAYDFTGGGNYCEANSSVSINKVGELRFKVKSDERQSILIRVTDSTGQILQFTNPYSAAKHWQLIGIGLGKGSPAHWGGKNDGVVHFPITAIALGVNKTTVAKSGKVEFADAETKR